MAWDPITSPCDYIILGGAQSPGIAEVSGALDERDLLVRQPPFLTGAVILYRRKKLAEFSVKIRLYTAEHHAAFTAWRTVIDAKPDLRTKARALDIWHPLLEQVGVKQCVVKSVSQLEQTDEGEWTIAVAFIESIPVPVQTLAKVEGAKASESDAIDKEIDERTEELERLREEQAAMQS